MYQQPPEGQPPFQQYYPQPQQPGYPPQSGSLQPPQPQSGYLPPQQQTPFTPPPASYIPPQPQKKSKTWLWIVACVLCLFLGYATGSGGKSAPATTDDTATVAQTTPATSQGQTKAATSKPTQAPTKAPQWQTTQTFSGDGTKKTGTFTVADNWKLSWKCDPASFSGYQYNVIVTIYGSDNTMHDVAINTLCKSGNTSGETEEHTGGSIYLDVNSEGSWNVTIQELK
jgi:hypothetical protein